MITSAAAPLIMLRQVPVGTKLANIVSRARTAVTQPSNGCSTGPSDPRSTWAGQGAVAQNYDSALVRIPYPAYTPDALDILSPAWGSQNTVLKQQLDALMPWIDAGASLVSGVATTTAVAPGPLAATLNTPEGLFYGVRIIVSLPPLTTALPTFSVNIDRMTVAIPGGGGGPHAATNVGLPVSPRAYRSALYIPAWTLQNLTDIRPAATRIDAANPVTIELDTVPTGTILVIQSITAAAAAYGGCSNPTYGYEAQP